MKTFLKRYVILLLFIFMGTLPSLAQESVPLTILPAKQEIVLEKSGQKNLDITVFNRGKEPIVGKFEAQDFVVQENDGIPLFLTDSPFKERSARSWISFSTETATIEPGKSYTLPITITVPPNATAGGHYAAILFQPALSYREGSTNVSIRVASLISIKIEGSIDEEAQLSFFKAPSFLEYGPVPIDFSIINSGDYHVVPHGKLQLRNMFGGVIDEAQIERLNVFPDSAREYKTQLGKMTLLGPYRAHISLIYGEKKNALEEDRLVVIFPWKLFLIVLLGLVILFYMGKGMKYNKTPNEDFRSEDLVELKRKLKKKDV